MLSQVSTWQQVFNYFRELHTNLPQRSGVTRSESLHVHTFCVDSQHVSSNRSFPAGGGGGGGHLDNLYIISSVSVYQSSDVAYRQSHQLASAPALAEKLPL